MCMPDRDWIDISSALLTPAIAIAGIAIGIFQWRLNKAQFRREQFDRSFSMFETIRAYLVSIISAGYPTQDAKRKFLGGTSGSRFVFNESISKFVSDIWERSVDLETFHSEFDRLQGTARTENIREQRKIKDRLETQLKEMEKKFLPFLAVHK